MKNRFSVELKEVEPNFRKTNLLKFYNYKKILTNTYIL